MIPFPSPKQADFGDSDGDGRSEDFRLKQDRITAVRAYIDETLARWNAAGFKNLRLAGFYWMQESFNDDEAEVLRQASAYAHEKGFKMFWIPYYFGNPGTPQWQKKGFDCAAQQPNYFFPRWQAEKTRVATTARMARRFGMGMEMEFDESLMSSDEQYAKYIKYLDTGVEEKYMTGSYVAWYQGSRTLLSLARSADPHLRRLYDLTYDFVKGTYAYSK